MRNFGTLVALFLLTVLVSTASAGDGSSHVGDFQLIEFSLLGQSSSSSWQSLLGGEASVFDQSGTLKVFAQDEFGSKTTSEWGSDEEGNEPDSSNLGRKIKTGFLSALMPGAGQYYNGYKKKAYLMAGVEVGIWTAFFVFDKQGDNRMETARDYAAFYAGTSGSHEDTYWQSVGKYMDSDAYNESRMREARALQEPVSGLVDGDEAWQWVNEDRMGDFQLLRADGNTAYDHRDFMILFSVINRAFSVIDGVMGVKSHPGGMEVDVLGMNVSVDMVPSWTDPGARWAVARRF